MTIKIGSQWIAACVFTILSAAPGLAQAFGEKGHRITGLVAERLLTPEARKGVIALMGSADLATFSLHLEKNKKLLDQRMPGSREWHYDDKPVCNADVPKRDYCPDGNCASVQINRHYRALIVQHSTRADKRFSIYALVHLIGDIHQPLHSADNDDSGGNGVAVKFVLNNRTIRTNLHSAWDTEFVKAAFEEVDERKIAASLVQTATPSDMRTLQKGSPATWLQTSYELAKTFAYGRLQSFACGAEDSGGQRLVLDDAYTADAVRMAPDLLLRAGARIAGVLNRAFAN